MEIKDGSEIIRSRLVTLWSPFLTSDGLQLFVSHPTANFDLGRLGLWVRKIFGLDLSWF